MVLANGNVRLDSLSIGIVIAEVKKVYMQFCSGDRKSYALQKPFLRPITTFDGRGSNFATDCNAAMVGLRLARFVTW
jgi:hypothetical protein